MNKSGLLLGNILPMPLRVNGGLAITWDNVASIGDKNIQQVIDLIKSNKDRQLNKLKFPQAPRILNESQASEWAKISHDFFLQVEQDLDKEVIEYLEKLKTGVNKPLLPIFRNSDTYLKQTSVFFVKNKNVEAEWKLCLVGRDGMHPSSYRIVSAKPIWQKLNFGNSRPDYGYTYQMSINTHFLMSLEEFIFFKQHLGDIEFIELWFTNSYPINGPLMKLENFYKLLEKPIQTYDDFKFPDTFRELRDYMCNPSNFHSDYSDNMKKIALEITQHLPPEEKEKEEESTNSQN